MSVKTSSNRIATSVQQQLLLLARTKLTYTMPRLFALRMSCSFIPPPVVLQRFAELGILHSRGCRGGRHVVRRITTLQGSRDERHTTTCVALAPVTTLRSAVNNYTWGRTAVGVQIRGGERRREERSGRFDRVNPNTSDNTRTALRYIAREELAPSTKRQHSTDQTCNTAPTLYVGYSTRLA